MSSTTAVALAGNSAVAIDFETYYDTRLSITTMGAWGYLQHDDVKIYLVSIFDGEHLYVGDPLEFDWDSIAGREWVSHNSAFDELVYDRLCAKSKGEVKARPSAWHCSSNLAAYLCGGARSLKDACQLLLGIDVSKDVRTKMKGKTLHGAMEAGIYNQLIEYAERDAKYCWAIWNKYQHLFPAMERALARLTIEQGWEGFFVNQQAVENALDVLGKVKFEAGLRLPWTKYDEKPLSPKALKKWCAKEGIEAPASTDEDDEECQQWEAMYSHRFSWVNDLRIFRRTNTFIKKIQILKDRRRLDGSVPFELKYFGAHTGRWSGGSRFNIQNLPKDDVEFECNGAKASADIRGMILPRPGYRLISADLSQIEPRVLAWLTDDWSLLNEVKKGMAIYEAHARSSMGWTGGDLKKENKDIYALAKARVLSLGYGAGWAKFITMATSYGVADLFKTPVTDPQIEDFRIYLTKFGRKKNIVNEFNQLDRENQSIWVNSWLQVRDFRQSNQHIIALWRQLQADLEASVGDHFELELPSGRKLIYRDVRKSRKNALTEKEEISYTAVVAGERSHFYGGLLTENLVQAAARDVFAENMLLVANEFSVIFSVHDEVVCEVKAEEANDALKRIEQLMSNCPVWLDGCPIGAEAKILTKYEK